jgi:hypothetical protein
MGMTGAALPPPPGAGGPPMGGPPTGAGPGGQSITPTPPQPPSPQATQAVMDINAIVQATRSIAQNFPAAALIVRQINDLVQQLQLTIVQSLPPTEVAAPPV